MARNTGERAEYAANRVYAPSEASRSVAYGERRGAAYGGVRLASSGGAMPARESVPSPAQRPDRREREAPQRRRSRQRRRLVFSLRGVFTQNLFVPKLLMILFAVCVAAVAFHSLWRYAGIARLQSSINDLNAQIELTREQVQSFSYESRPLINATELAESAGLVQKNP